MPETKKSMKAKLLYVEDDETLSFVTQDNLELQGYNIDHTDNGREALKMWKEAVYDLCILDVMLPEMDGFALANEIRKNNTDVPIIFLTAKSMKEDKIHGLRLGGDDYITKPFSIEELILKIEIFLKRNKVNILPQATIFEFGQYLFDYPNLSLRFQEDPSKILTQKEADLLKYFAENSNKVIKRSAILESIWGEDDYFMGRSLDVFISRLRKYLNSDENLKIENIHGVGFKFKTN